MQDLNALMEGLRDELNSCDVSPSRLFAVTDLFKGRAWYTDTPFGEYPHVLKAMLLRIPLTIYVHEQPDGAYNVLRGGEVIEALRCLQKPEPGRNLALYRRIADESLNVVIFRASMSYKDVQACLKLIYF